MQVSYRHFANSMFRLRSTPLCCVRMGAQREAPQNLQGFASCVLLAGSSETCWSLHCPRFISITSLRKCVHPLRNVFGIEKGVTEIPLAPLSTERPIFISLMASSSVVMPPLLSSRIRSARSRRMRSRAGLRAT
ncbi:hypothetical protein EYF80_016087 [Liparis tanakae]|uniref:Uncharacterized protein n=1 Tax=Liparis tanakae TaxID=230148 RepID=A0A4Z2I6P3_9TELE|nr:hypothetical protein EYF80_016087 [Liparis tanakae]